MSYSVLYYHLIWATKHRLPLITMDVEPILFATLRALCEEQKVVVHALNGWEDHVHLVASIPPSLAIATCMNTLKGKSSYVLNQKQHHSQDTLIDEFERLMPPRKRGG